MYYKTPNFNSKCKACTLTSGQSVAGQSEVPFEQVALIVVSAYPGTNEIKSGISLAPATKEGKSNRAMNAGEFFRLALRSIIDSDPDFPEELKPLSKFCYLTNAIKCSPQQGRDKRTITAAHIRTCNSQWLSKELRMFNPKTPLLLAASEAVKSVMGPNESVYSNRRQVFTMGEHPTVVTFNPIEAERGLLKTIDNEDDVKKDLIKLFTRVPGASKQVSKLLESKFWRPAAPFSMAWHFQKDLLLVKELVIEYYKNYLSSNV